MGRIVVDSGPEGEQFKADEMMESEAMLLGRLTYEGYAPAWAPRGGEYADKINAMPKHVVSSTLENPDWNNTSVIGRYNAAAITALKDRTAGDILIHGSAQLTTALLTDELVDEWRLMFFPIVVGAGKRCFGDPGEPRRLRLVDSRTVGDGIAILTYQPPAK